MKVTPFCLLHTKVTSASQALQVLEHKLACGFPSPADDYIEAVINLDALLIKHPAATILGRATGKSMINRGILSNSIVLIDRAIEPEHDATIVASIAGELTIKILDLRNKRLLAANNNHPPILLPDDLDVICEGVVTFALTPQKGIAFSC